MIRHITGTVLRVSKDSTVIEVGGIGLFIRLLPEKAGQINPGEHISLNTYLAVREDALDLYGFSEEEELSFFELLIGISGIGPRSAMNILSIVPYQTLGEAVARGNVAYLTKVSGIGRKTAEKIILELKEKVVHLSEKEDTLSQDNDALLALVSLGYNRQAARDALRATPGSADAGVRIKEALRILSKKDL